MNASQFTREDYLLRVTEAVRPWFAGVGFPVPDVHVSVGFPSRRPFGGTLGECFGPQLSADHTPQIFISPLIGDGLRAADVLVHELLHASVGVECGHRGSFVRGMRAIGLAGKPTSTHAGPELNERLNDLLNSLGTYPHPKLLLSTNKQSTRLIKTSCSSCGYIARVSRMWLRRGGPPICPLCKWQMQEDGDE